MQLLHFRTGCAFISGRGTTPRKSGRLGRAALEALARDRGGGARRPRRCSGAAGGSFSDDFRTPGTESQIAIDLLDERFPAESGDTANVVFAAESGTLREPDRRAAIERTIDEIRGQPHVTGAPSPFAEDSGRLSEDARIAYVPVQYDDTASALGQEPGQRLEQASELGEPPDSRSPATGRSWTRPSRRPPRSAS